MSLSSITSFSKYHFEQEWVDEEPLCGFTTFKSLLFIYLFIAVTAESKWPSGTYGLPKPVEGCPAADGFEWKTGYRFHDTEDDGTENQHSDSFHLAGEFSDEGIRHEFCIKSDEDGAGR